MSSSGDRDSLSEVFRGFIDPTAPRLSDKVNFGGIISATINSIVLVFFLMLVGIADAAGRGFAGLLEAFELMVRLVVSAPSLTLGEIQREALEIAARDIQVFGVAALPVGFIVSLSAIAVVVVFFNVFWRP